MVELVRQRNAIPGLSAPTTSDLAVLKPFQLASSNDKLNQIAFCEWLGNRSPSHMVLFLLLFVLVSFPALAAGGYGIEKAMDALFRWMPFLLSKGFLFNVLISVLVMLIGTAVGALVGLGQISLFKPLRIFCWSITQFFRNSPWLVLLFIVMLAFPFEINIGGLTIPVPDWMKAVIGLSLPIMANIAEIVRGAVQSVPTGQWEAAESLAFSRTKTLWQIILPQCFKRMIPPWMNWYAILTMATPLVSILGVEDILRLSRDAMEAEGNNPALLMPFYSFILILFFIYCYPIAKWTQRLERKFNVKT
ncbi:MAG: amino acid ABC transporter permease [Gammaproteobacteria bacterium]|nr:amino acid ABC transporter permease [Gammaproteobacteria bacterium]